MKDWQSQAHVRWDCKYHVVIVPKYRQRVFFGKRRKQIGDPNVQTHYSYRVVTRAGETRWVDQYSKTIMYEGRPADFVMAMDITAIRNSQGVVVSGTTPPPHSKA